MTGKRIEGIIDSIEEYLTINGPKYSREIYDYLTINDMMGRDTRVTPVRIGHILRKNNNRFKPMNKKDNFILWTINEGA